MAECIRDDSTDCACPRCAAAEDAFWREQGEDRDQTPPHPDDLFDVADLDDQKETAEHPEDDVSW